MNLIRKTGIIFACLTLLILITGIYLYKDYQRFKQTSLNVSQEDVLIIDRGQSFHSVLNQLLDKKLLMTPDTLNYLLKKLVWPPRLNRVNINSSIIYYLKNYYCY